MVVEYIAGLEVTYGNALAVGGSFHRVTTTEGTAAEITPHTYLWYRLATGNSSPATGSSSKGNSLYSAPSPSNRKQLSSSTSSSGGGSSGIDGTAYGITHLRMGGDVLAANDAHVEDGDSTNAEWIKLDKSIDRQRGLFLWYKCADWRNRPPLSTGSTSSTTSTETGGGAVYPFKEIRVVRDLKDIPDGFELITQDPIISCTSGSDKELRTYLCYRRLSQEDFSNSKWSIHTQKAGNWIEVKDLSSNKWNIAQIVTLSSTEIRVQIATWGKNREDYLSRATCRNRVAKLGTNTNVYMSPSYPFTKRQGSVWNVGMKDLEKARDDFDEFFFETSDQHETYLTRSLIPFVEKSLLCAFFSSEMADDMNAFHQHVLKNLVARLLSIDEENDAKSLCHLLSVLRMILNGHNSCMFFYLKYPGTYSAARHSKLVYTSYLTSSEVLATIPTRHPCRSFYFVDNVDLFIQAGGLRVILQRLAVRDVPLTELVLFSMVLNQAKPCLVQQKRRRSSSSKRRSSSSADVQVEDFFRDFLNATFARLRRMNSEELKDDDGLIDQIVGILDMLYRDGALLGNNTIDSDLDDTSSSDNIPSSSVSACDPTFAEAIEVFHLDLSKKFICCPFLAQRLVGIARINDLIAMVQRKDALQKKTSLGLKRSGSTSASVSFPSSSMYSLSANQHMTKWLRSKYTVEWLASSDILEVILGDGDTCTKYGLSEGIHLEILKRSKSMFEFVAIHGLLNERHILLLWKTAMNQLRSGRKTVFDILISLCGVLTAELLDVIVMLLTQVPQSDYDELLVQFIKRIISIASKKVVETESAGSRKSLTSLVSAAAGAKNYPKLSSAVQKDVDILNKVVSLGCCLLWNAILQSETNESSSALRPALRADVEAALAESVNHIQKLWKAANSSSASAREQQQLLSDYMKKCAENIRSGTLVETSMSLIQRVSDGYGSGTTSASSSSSLSLSRVSQPMMSSSELLQNLDASFGIVSAVLQEIKHYMMKASNHSASNDHIIAIRRRLDFLGYLVTNSDLQLSYSDIAELWACFHSPTNMFEERELFFAWFISVSPDPNNFVHRAYTGNTALSSTVTTEIFQSLIKPTAAPDDTQTDIHLDMNTMGKQAFWALERLFRFINTSARLISPSAIVGNTARVQNISSNVVEDNGLFVAESMDLKGLETMYDVALCAENESVSQEAINYLIFIQLHVGSKLVRREVWAEFVHKCFDRLKAYASSSVEAPKTRQVQRVLVLVSTFLHQSVVQSSEDSGYDTEELTVYVKTQDGRLTAPFRYNLRRTSLVSELRDRIAKDTGHPADRVRIINELKTKLTAQGHGKFTLEKARIFNAHTSAQSSTEKYSITQTAPAPVTRSKRNSYVEAVLLTKVESDTAGHTHSVMDYGINTFGGNTSTGYDGDWQATKAEISSNDEWVGLLLNLLSYHGSISEEAWKVLKLLGSDSRMEKQMRTLNGVLAIDCSIRKFPSLFNWNSLLDPTCPSKLLYQLELVEKFSLCSIEEPEGAVDERDEKDNGNDDGTPEGMIGIVNVWSKSFLQLGGKRHLENFVLECLPHEVIAQGTLSVMCLSKLLKLLRHFAMVESKVKEEEGASVDGTSQRIICQLLEILNILQSLEDKSAGINGSLSSCNSSHASTNEESPVRITTYTRPIIHDPDNVNDLPSQAYLMTRALSYIATTALVSSQSALPLLESYPNHGKILLKSLVESQYKPVRQEAANVIAALSTMRNQIQEDRVMCCRYFLDILGGYTGIVSDEEYYNVYTLLVTHADDLAKLDILSSCRTLCRRVKAFVPSDDPRSAYASVTISPNAIASDNIMPKSSNTVLDVPDALLKALLSTLLAIVKRIPPILAGGPNASYHGRSLREVVSSTLHEEEEIMDELFHKCLFATTDNQSAELSESTCMRTISSSQYYLQQPKCRSESCRMVAFELLSELSQDNTKGLRFLLTQMAQQHTLASSPEPKGVGSPPLSSSKRKAGKIVKDASSHHQMMQRGKYVGLKNLGCTCYLNSTMQAFFMIPRFRRQILRFNAGSYSHSPTPQDGKGLMYELQSLFAHLEGTAKPYYNPKPFTSAMKTWDGESIDLNMQQDASEFLTSFFQQLESEMNGLGSMDNAVHTDDNILSTFFGGVFSNELVAEGDRYSERFEPFHFISVPVRDRKNLKESLDGWVEGENVSYTWEQNNDDAENGGDKNTERVTLDTHKRISIEKLPEYLIIHLKRFEFDFERMQQIKLHDRFEFPMELDMYDYTKEGQEAKRKRSSSASSLSDDGTRNDNSIADGSSDIHGRKKAPEYSQYELVGTVVHMGTAHSGHYYSFLREQDSTSENSHWYEFNDTVVSPFDAEQIPNECFGGEDDQRLRRVSGASSSSSGMPRMKNRSSFMLFYARSRPKLRFPKKVEPYQSAIANVIAVVFCMKLKRRSQTRLQQIRNFAQVIAPEPIRDQIAMENRLFWRKKYLYDTWCLKFTYDLIKSCLVDLENAKHMAIVPRFEPIEVRLEALQMATKFVFGTLWHAGDVAKVLEWRLILQALYHSEVDGCHWFLTTVSAHESLLLDLLVFNEHMEVRELMAAVLSEAIVTTSNVGFEEESSSLDSKLMNTAIAPEAKKLPASFEFIFLLVQLMPALLSVPVHHHRQYFLTMWNFVQTGRNEGIFLVVNSVVGAIVALLTGLGHTQPLLQAQLKNYKHRQILKSIDLSATVLKLLSVLIRCGLPPAIDVSQTPLLPPNMAQDHVDLTPADHDVLLNERFITLLTQRANRYTKETKSLDQIVIHLCWESRQVTALFMDKIMNGIEVEDHHDVKPYFRTFNSLLKIRDSLASERLTDGMTKLIAVMASQQRYYKATETSIDMLTRLAKRHSNVARWLVENNMSCAWMEKWLMGHRGGEGYLQQRKTSLVKPNSTSSWINVSVNSAGLIKAIDRTISKLLPRVRSIFDPQTEMETFYDSDDNPTRLVGKRVRVKWAKDKWYEGTVERFDEATYEHFVIYDDGDKRSYHMSEKLFYVVESTAPTSGSTKKKKQQQQLQ